MPRCLPARPRGRTRHPPACRAAAKAGHSVLQLDPSDHYGGAWASLPLDELAGLLQDAGADVGTPTGAASQLGQQADSSSAADAGQQQGQGLSLAAAAGIRGAQVWQRDSADLGPSRQYCLDLAPKVSNERPHVPPFVFDAVTAPAS